MVVVSQAVSSVKRRLEGAKQKRCDGLGPSERPPSTKTATAAFCIHAVRSGTGLVDKRFFLQQDNDLKHMYKLRNQNFTEKKRKKNRTVSLKAWSGWGLSLQILAGLE